MPTADQEGRAEPRPAQGIETFTGEYVRRTRRCGVSAGIAEVFAPERVLQQPKQHADAGGGKAKMPVNALPQVAAHQRRDERAGVDAHVED